MSPCRQIGADLTTNLVILSPQLITLHDPDLIRFEDCYNTFRTPLSMQTMGRTILGRRRVRIT